MSKQHTYKMWKENKGRDITDRGKTVYRGFAEEASDSYCTIQTRRNITQWAPGAVPL